MAEFIHLIGADDVRSAGHKMQAAATDMSNAAANLEHTLHIHRIFMDEWLMRFEEILNRDKEGP